jgi:hypothetical protein
MKIGATSVGSRCELSGRSRSSTWSTFPDPIGRLVHLIELLEFELTQTRAQVIPHQSFKKIGALNGHVNKSLRCLLPLSNS